MKVIILAGGSGTRLWPLSRDRYPKQFIKLMSREESLFQETFQRSLLIADKDDIYVVTNEKYKFLVMGSIEELGCDYPEDHILVEPEAKNTLPAIYAGVHEILKYGDDTVVVLPSDHIIQKGDAFTNLIKETMTLSEDSLITFGIKPDGPNVGYGYISGGKLKGNGFVVDSFKEKPTIEKAREYITQGYYWNAGIFMFRAGLFADEVKFHAPEIYEAFEGASSLDEAFAKIHTKVSIDYGIMEKSNKVAVVPAGIKWNDLGSFDSFYDLFEKDMDNNIVSSDNITINSKNNLISSEDGKLIATVGVDNLIIVDNRDALLICQKDQSQRVKEVVDTLIKKNDIRTQYHVQDYRPWGNYRILEEQAGLFKIKHITVTQGKKLSYQLHHHRSEHWIVVSGMARVTIDDEVSFVRTGESIFMKAGQKHRLENPGKIPLEIIEVQNGQYLNEDDIIRLDDEFGRK